MVQKNIALGYPIQGHSEFPETCKHCASIGHSIDNFRCGILPFPGCKQKNFPHISLSCGGAGFQKRRLFVDGA